MQATVATAGESVDFYDFTVFVPCKFTDSGSYHRGADKGGKSSDHMDRAGTGEIMEAQLGQPAAAPDSVSFNRIDYQGDYTGINTVRKELGAFSHGTGYDGRRCGAEYKVKYKI